MKRYRSLLLIVIAILCTVVPAWSISIVDTPLGNDFSQIFPELSEGYIDLNSNGSMDRLEDMDEKVSESLVQDGVLQVQEVLDFIIEQFRFFPVAKLEQIQTVLSEAEGQIAEIIALSYETRMAEVIERKREFGADDLYLTPSALRRAHEEMSGYIATMLHAYKKEEQEYVQQFSDARESLFSMIEAGYPLPPIGTEDRNLLVSAMVHTILSNDERNQQRVKAAINTLGRMQAESALPYLKNLLDSAPYQAEAAAALGEIGNTQARSILMNALKTSEPGEYQYSLIRAVGKVGGEESAEYLLSILPDKEGDTTVPENLQEKKEATIVKSLADLASQGSRNRKIFTVLSDYLSHESPEIRRVAVEGIAGFGARLATTKLLPLLKDEPNEKVKITLVRSLNALNDASTIPTFINILDEPSTSSTLKQEIIQAVGRNDNGSRGVPTIITYLSDENQEVRTTARKALLNQYQRDSKTVISNLSRSVLQSEDSLFLEQATSIIAEVADEAALTTLLRMLETPYPEVLKNVTWAFYRIRPQGNARIVGEIQQLVTSETQPVQVRINAVRALGAMRTDNAQLEVYKTLLTTLKLRAPEYSMLRYYAIESLSQLSAAHPEVIDALLQSASPGEEQHLRLAALQALRTIGAMDAEALSTVAGMAKRSEDIEIMTAAVRLLGDAGSEETVGIASSILENTRDGGTHTKIAYALSRLESDTAVELLIDMAAGSEQEGFILGLLREVKTSLLRTVVQRRRQTESNQEVRQVLDKLETSLTAGL
ncbi:MAG: HEAT repeat domain-containing protein [Spirochaetaceae bacterium]|nr:HEAT repeat domain-containing protein [Spirochaetaceae bacterium]MCF7948927.1 HEAT repeat domain-containing protein [Spirochaetia bacterium]MCF7950891.1 HEAT repeat domain-containing protein [Spirochaetaceae bacterium]